MTAACGAARAAEEVSAPAAKGRVSAKATLSRAETGEQPHGSTGRSAFPAWAPRPRFPRLREAPGPLRRPPLPVPEPGFPRGPCARGAGAPRSQEGPCCTGPWLVWRLGPSLPGAGAERWSCLLETLASPPPHPSCPRGGDCEARTHRGAWTRTVPVLLCSVTCPCAERSRRVRGSAQSPMS